MTAFLSACTFAMYQNYYNEYGQFYPAMRQFSRNSTAMILSFLQWICMVYLCTKGVIKIFFGNLRSIEVDNINQNFWMSITDTALTLTIGWLFEILQVRSVRIQIRLGLNSDQKGYRLTTSDFFRFQTSCLFSTTTSIKSLCNL